MNEASEFPDHQSSVRRMMADAHGTRFQPLRTLEEARQFIDGVAVLQGDWGGQIYAVIPAQSIECPAFTLQRLLLDLDSKAWACNENEGASIYYERISAGQGVSGGMGGGKSTGQLWVHSEFEELYEQISRIIDGKQESITFS